MATRLEIALTKALDKPRMFDDVTTSTYRQQIASGVFTSSQVNTVPKYRESRSHIDIALGLNPPIMTQCYTLHYTNGNYYIVSKAIYEYYNNFKDNKNA